MVHILCDLKFMFCWPVIMMMMIWILLRWLRWSGPVSWWFVSLRHSQSQLTTRPHPELCFNNHTEWVREDNISLKLEQNFYKLIFMALHHKLHNIHLLCYCIMTLHWILYIQRSAWYWLTGAIKIWYAVFCSKEPMNSTVKRIKLLQYKLSFC